MSKLDKTEVLSAFEAAYETANGKKPEITTKPGWYSIDGGKNLRLADVAELTKKLNSGKTAKTKKTKAAAPAKADDSGMMTDAEKEELINAARSAGSGKIISMHG